MVAGAATQLPIAQAQQMIAQQVPDAALRAYLQDNAEELLQAIRRYVRSARLPASEVFSGIELEILSETTIEALKGARRFDASRPTLPWLFKIAVNMVKRRRAEGYRRMQHEQSMMDTALDGEDADDHFVERFRQLAAPAPDAEVEAKIALQRALALVPEDDRQVLLLEAQDFTGAEIAAALNTTPGTARLRVHRARQKLHKACRDHDIQF